MVDPVLEDLALGMQSDINDAMTKFYTLDIEDQVQGDCLATILTLNERYLPTHDIIRTEKEWNLTYILMQNYEGTDDVFGQVFQGQVYIIKKSEIEGILSYIKSIKDANKVENLRIDGLGYFNRLKYGAVRGKVEFHDIEHLPDSYSHEGIPEKSRHGIRLYDLPSRMLNRIATLFKNLILGN